MHELRLAGRLLARKLDLLLFNDANGFATNNRHHMTVHILTMRCMPQPKENQPLQIVLETMRTTVHWLPWRRKYASVPFLDL